MDFLKKRIHSYSIQKNEALNQCIAWVAPNLNILVQLLHWTREYPLLLLLQMKDVPNFMGNYCLNLWISMCNHHIMRTQWYSENWEIEKLRQKTWIKRYQQNFKKLESIKFELKSRQVYEERISKEKKTMICTNRASILNATVSVRYCKLSWIDEICTK